ncbi:2'-5' RNA ligase family protein [Cnuibacter physcomitrellae]|uniref:2'-5' RNA ligase family protein n=1 Tax=Cnuibacter physcomitrellae TaxID=1619308 RepID=UPI002175B40D|nr:2'-5' RNA ligase family protein [Cnuibacter physcomitrellae]MCS5496333.1 2'-5' RNA ligase family protein [Cnuibacter physcomitrellae]
MRSVELTLDGASDAAVREDWGRLADAGLPSLADHTGASNRPHVTLAAGERLEVDEPRLAAAAATALPLSLSFSGLLLFGARGGRFVLVRAVVVSSELATLHGSASRHITAATPTSLPGAWTPHVTLARRLSAPQVSTALEVLDASAPPALADACRLWLGEVKAVREIAGQGTVGRI